MRHPLFRQIPLSHQVVTLQSELNWRVPVAKPLWAGSQVFVFVVEEFAAERADRGRENKKRSVGKRKSIVESKAKWSYHGSETSLHHGLRNTSLSATFPSCPSGLPPSRYSPSHLLLTNKILAGEHRGHIVMTSSITTAWAQRNTHNTVRERPSSMQMAPRMSYPTCTIRPGAQRHIPQPPTKRQTPDGCRRCALVPARTCP